MPVQLETTSAISSLGDLLLQDGALLLLVVQRLLGLFVAALQRRDRRVAQLGGARQVAFARGALLSALASSIWP
jgi:hypothetical protein